MDAVLSGARRWEVVQGDAVEVLRSMPDACVDAVVSDPPYAEVDRPYGRLTEREWMRLMKAVTLECRRVLKPTGSAVFVLQPNSERVGRMRTWLWDFMAWAGRAWGQVQDFYWWNPTAPPTVHTHRARGLARPSVKACIWLGLEDCYRDQESVMWGASEATLADKRTSRALKRNPGGNTVRYGRILERVKADGTSTPFNLIPMPNADSTNGSGSHGHGAGTPLGLCDWWCAYICPRLGVVLDPFAGLSTVGVAALRGGRRFIGIEKEAEYVEKSRARLVNDAPLFNADTEPRRG